MEQETKLERQREGIAMVRAKGIYKGRVRGSKESSKDFLSKYPDLVDHLNNGHRFGIQLLAEVGLFLMVIFIPWGYMNI